MKRRELYRRPQPLFLNVALLIGAVGAAHAEAVYPMEPIVGVNARRILEISDGPDPWGIVAHAQGDVAAQIPLSGLHRTDGDTSPDTAVDPTHGRIATAWSERGATGWSVALAAGTDEGWSEPTLLSPQSALDPRPSMAFLPDGTLVLVFVVSDGATSIAHVRTASPPLGIWSEAVSVSEPGEWVTSAHVAVHGGVAQFAYARLDGPATSIVHAVPNGAEFEREVVGVSSYAESTIPEIHSHSGVLWVDWVDAQAPTGAGELAWKRRNASGAWETASYAAFESAFQRDYHVRPGLKLQAIAP